MEQLFDFYTIFENKKKETIPLSDYSFFFVIEYINHKSEFEIGIIMRNGFDHML